MTTYLRSWLTGAPVVQPERQPGLETDSTLANISITLPDDAEGSDTETERDDDDSPPAFPALSSAQRLDAPRVLSDSQLMPPPSMLPSRIQSSSLGVPPGRVTSSNSLGVLATTKLAKKREKVALKPGHGPLDWANLKASGQDLRGVDALMRIPPSVLKRHNKRDDAWSAFHGKVYNITPYMEYHPGGEKDLLRVAGRDGTKLFAQTHAWINADLMLDACLVGFLVPEPSS